MNTRDLFIQALQIEGKAERSAFLDGICVEDVSLRLEVEKLLDVYNRAESFLEIPPPSVVAATEICPVTEQPGDTIGPYKLLQQIGEGGMGVVYMAEQTHPVERRVALKIIKPGMDTRQVIARFEAERQALAMMDHPNIAKVLDAGTTDSGRPYFVMELVKGMPVTQYCDEQHLSPRERLELFVPICQAVQHAHQKGIIHRDLKPSNILIARYDDKPVPKIIDFGVAKATSQRLTEKTMFTQYGQIVGTMEYMSPEQANFNQLDVDTRSDIYSLGVLLYELLTGETPFDKKRLRSAAFDELLRIIREEEPPRMSVKLSTCTTLASVAANRHMEPHKLGTFVRGELDWIVMKALEKDRGRRYDTASKFAEDVRHYLNNEAVVACPPSAAYRFRKFARRNRVALGTAAMLAATLVAGIIGTTWQAIRATHEAERATKAEALADERYEAEKAAREQAEAARVAESEQRQIADQQRQLAEVEKQRAEENFDKARRAVDEYLSQVTENELLAVPGLQPLREDLLQAALTFYAEFTQERADDPTLQRELASAHYRIGMIQRDLGNVDSSRQANSEAVRLYEQLRHQGNETVELQAALAGAYFFADRYDDTVKLCQMVMQAAPEHGAVRSLLADTYNQLAVTESKKKNIAAALKYHQQAFDLREGLVRDFPDDPRYLAQLGGTVNNLGVLLDDQGKHEEALAMFERGVAYSAQAYERAPHSILWGRWLCTGLRNVATKQEAAGRQEEALRSYERLVSVSRKRAFENPSIGSLRGDLCGALLALANYQKRLGDAAEASRSFRLAREILEQTPRETPDQLFELATVYAVLASPQTEAESREPSEEDGDELRRSADLAMETLKNAVDAGYQNASVLNTNRDLDPLRGRDDFQALLATVQQIAEADRLAKAEDKDAATRLSSRRQAADLLKGLAGAEPASLRHRTTLAATLQSIGAIQTGLKQFDEAEKSFDEALKLREELLTEQSEDPQARVDVLATRTAMGQLDWDRDRPQDAHRLFQEILTECQGLAVEHGEDVRLQTGIVGIERSIANKYGEIGLLEECLQSVDRGLETAQLFDAAGDCRGAHVLAAQGRLAEHRQMCQLIVDKWGKSIPAQVVWAATMNPQPVVEVEQLLELAERVIKSDLDPLWKFKAATAWYRAGDYNRALELMLAARDKVAADGSSACLHWYAMVYDKLGQKEVAARYFEEAEAKYLKSADNCLRGSEKSAVKDAHAGAWWIWAEDQAARRLAWNELRGTVDLHDPRRHLIQARAFELIGEQSKRDAELDAAENAWQSLLEPAADDPLPWIQRARWYTERGEHTKADADFTKAASLTPGELNKFIEPGWWAATTPEGLSALFPQPMPNLPTSMIESTALASPTVVSAPLPAQTVEFRNVPELKDAETAYAMTYVYAPEARAVTLLVGGASAAELRLNGRLVYQWKTNRSAYEMEHIPVLLRPGRNTLVARVFDPVREDSLILRIGDNRLDRGLELARLGLWEEALRLVKPELAKGQRLTPHLWDLYSRLLPATGDFAGYRGFFHQVLDWIVENPSGRNAVLHASQICTLTPVPEADVARVVALIELVDEAVAKSSKTWSWPVEVQSKVYFRAGRYQEVLDRIVADGMGRSALRALCWHHLGQSGKAKSELQRAEREFIDIVSMGPEGPSSAKVSSYPHGLLDILGDYILLREARTLIAPGTLPDDQELHALIAQTREQLETADPRLLPFEVALIAGGNKPQAWLERGRARAILGQSELAQADFAKAAQIAPNDLEMLASRCLIYAELNFDEETIADVVKVLDKDADNTNSPGWLAARQRLFDEQGQWPELFERTTKLWPADPNPWISRARYFASRSRWRDPSSDGSQVRDERADLDQAMADLREAVARGFRDFDQPRTDGGWQTLESREDFQELVRETTDRNPDDLILLAKLEGHTQLVRGVAFLPDGERLVSVGRDNRVRIWDLETRSELSSFAVEGVLRDADVSADGRLVGMVSNDGATKGVAVVWDLQKQKRLGVFVQDFKWTEGICFSPDSTHFVTIGNPSCGVLWELSTGKEQQRFMIEDASDGQAAAFSPDGRLLALSTVGRVHLFDITSSAPISTIRLPNNRYVEELLFSGSGAHLASSQNGGHVSLIDVDSRRVIKSLRASESTVGGLQFLSGDRFIIAASFDGALRIWDIQQENVISTGASKVGYKELSVSPDGRFAVTAGGELFDEASKKWKTTGDHALRLWRLPKSVWTEPHRQSSGDAVSEAEEN